MHVCHICDTSVAGEYFRILTTGLTRNEIRVTLVELGSGTPPEWLADIPNAAYFCLGADSKLQYPSAVRRMVRFLKDERVDILHTHLYFSGLIGVLTKRLNRATVVALMRHHTSVVRMLGSRLHIATDKWMAEKADHVLAVSKAVRDYMLDVDGVERRDIEVVYLGFDFEKMAPNLEERARVRSEFGFGDEDIVIGYIAHVVTGKGHIQLVEAFERIIDDIPTAKLFFVGSQMMDDVRAAAAKFAEGQIVFAGWRDDVAACFNAMDIFVQPSLSEAFSQVLIEAMGVGLPVIATNVGGASEVIDDEMNGFLIEPCNAAEISEKVVQLGRDAALRAEIRAAGRNSVVERFTIEKLVDRHIELYERWLKERAEAG